VVSDGYLTLHISTAYR